METEQTEHGTLESWTPAEVAEKLWAGKIVLIDVRTPQEYSFERIDGALLAPLQSFQPQHMPGQYDKRIVFHCGSGARSRKAAMACLEAGADRIAHMSCGFGGWKEAGLPYTGTDLASGAPKQMKKKAA
ncbi:MAG: rhodanese-like domain-containing protein [Alphaproteobacteria bacterium]|nr:rhodanese-like domain-containing protein [Alphaproteobacteria bacterium]